MTQKDAREEITPNPRIMKVVLDDASYRIKKLAEGDIQLKHGLEELVRIGETLQVLSKNTEEMFKLERDELLKTLRERIENDMIDLKGWIEEHRTMVKDDYSLGITQILDTIKSRLEKIFKEFERKF